jgi:NAD(P)-dependent dehydrogenase (short-subunit alcohol dehydrogenase family)
MERIVGFTPIHPLPAPFGADPRARRGIGFELVDALAELALDAFGPSVRANAILPGPAMTDIALAWPEERRASIGANLPLRRPGHPEDFVGTALWLASAASAWITGVLVRVDGGAYRQMS